MCVAAIAFNYSHLVIDYLRDNPQCLAQLLSFLAVEKLENQEYIPATSSALERQANYFHKYEIKTLVCGLTHIFFSLKRELPLARHP